MAALPQKGRLPARLAMGDLVLLGVRAPFAAPRRAAGRGEVESEAQGEGPRRVVGELLICPFCITQWVGAALLVGLCAAPRTTRFTASLMALRTLADAMDIGHEAAAANVDKMEDVAKIVARGEASSE
jgi:hypothetical protein